ERGRRAQGGAECGHRRELVSPFRQTDGDEEGGGCGGEHEYERLLDATDAAEVDGRDRAHGLSRLLVDVLDADAQRAGRGCDCPGEAYRRPGSVDEDQVG